MDNLHLVQFAPPRFPSLASEQHSDAREGLVPAPSDAVRTFVFMANLYAQEASGDPAASASPERVVHRLRGSNESETYIFALIQGTAPLGEASSLGLPQVPSTGDCPDLDYVGFIHISIPLLEEKQTADVDFVLDVNFLPLPGEPLETDARFIADQLVQHGLDIARKLGRSTVQTGSLHSDETDAFSDPFSASYAQVDFEIRHAERQILVEVPQEPATLLVPAGMSAHVWPDYDIPDEYIDDVLDLLTIASEDSITGDLSVEPILWNRERLAQAHGRLRSRGAHTLIIAFVEARRVVSLTELGRHAGSDPEVAEWTMTVTARDKRRQHLASKIKLLALTSLREHWPEMDRTYTSIGVADEAMNRIYGSLGARGISQSEAWELKL